VQAPLSPNYLEITATCDGCSHCRDLSASSANDPPALAAQRKAVLAQIVAWVAPAAPAPAAAAPATSPAAIAGYALGGGALLALAVYRARCSASRLSGAGDNRGAAYGALAAA
jgi:hypothetical protein